MRDKKKTKCLFLRKLRELKQRAEWEGRERLRKLMAVVKEKKKKKERVLSLGWGSSKTRRGYQAEVPMIGIPIEGRMLGKEEDRGRINGAQKARGEKRFGLREEYPTDIPRQS